MNIDPNPAPALQGRHVYLLASICLLIGLATGYIVRGAPSAGRAAANTQPATQAGTLSGLPPGHAAGAMPTLADMKRMADTKAAPLLEKLKDEPNNTALLVQIGAIYHATHQFSQAAAYYDKAVQLEPKNGAFRVKLASSLYRSGDVDGAIAQLNRALSYEPTNANALFDLGMIKMEARQDNAGALAAWHQLLKTNSQLSPDRKAMVEKMIDAAQAHTAANRSAQQ